MVEQRPRALRLVARNTLWTPSMKALVTPHFRCANIPVGWVSTISITMTMTRHRRHRTLLDALPHQPHRMRLGGGRTFLVHPSQSRRLLLREIFRIPAPQPPTLVRGLPRARSTQPQPGPPHLSRCLVRVDHDVKLVGHHDHTRYKHLWLGSTAERVVRHAPCPVLVVREREQEFVKG